MYVIATLSVYPHRASLKNMPGHGGIRTYDLWNATIIFKTIGTDSPQAYSLRKIYSPAPPFQCCVPIFILFQAATVSAYSTTTLIGEGAGEGRNRGREPGLSS